MTETFENSATANNQQQTHSATTSEVSQVVQEVVRCKWMLHVLAAIRSGINRPGQLARSANGLTTKVLNERLEKLLRFGLVERTSYPEVPPRVEYTLTDRGRRFDAVLNEIDSLAENWHDV